MSRAVPEWIGKTDDAKVPPRVRLRIFERHNGICHISGRKIMPGEKWDLEHIKALIHGGEHRESNMAPALIKPHKVKTAEEMALKAKTDSVRKKHIGIKKPTSDIPARSFTKPAKAKQASRHDWAPKLRAQLYAPKEPMT